MTEVYNNVIFETTLELQRFWVKVPRHSENILLLAEMRYVYRRTRPEGRKHCTARTDK